MSENFMQLRRKLSLVFFCPFQCGIVKFIRETGKHLVVQKEVEIVAFHRWTQAQPLRSNDHREHMSVALRCHSCKICNHPGKKPAGQMATDFCLSSGRRWSRENQKSSFNLLNRHCVTSYNQRMICKPQGPSQNAATPSDIHLPPTERGCPPGLKASKGLQPALVSPAPQLPSLALIIFFFFFF